MAIITKADFGGTGGTSSNLGDRNKGAGTTAPPADQEILYNNASAASVTEIFIDDNDLDGADRSASIAKATSGILTISDKENGEDNYDKFEISGVADNTGYFTFTVTWLESKGTISGEVNVGVDIDPTNKISQTINFVDASVILEYTQGQPYKLTSVSTQPSVSVSIKLSGTSTDYNIGDTLNAWDKLDISVDIPGGIFIQGIIL